MEIKISYLICTTPRTGSSLLCEGLSSTGQHGHALEHFGREDFRNEFLTFEPSDFQRYLQSVITRGTTSNGIFGLKLQMKPDFFRSLIEFLNSTQGEVSPQRTSGVVLEDAFPNLHYVWLMRRNKIRQAVS